MCHLRFARGQAVAFALLLLTACGGRAAEPAFMDLARRAQANNDLSQLIETARTAWAYADDKEEHFDVSLRRLLKEGLAALENCQTERDVLVVYQRVVAEMKDGHAGLSHPALRVGENRRWLPHRLRDTKDGVVYDKNLVLLWNGRGMEEQIRESSQRICASTPGMRRLLALRSMESGSPDDPVRITLQKPDGRTTNESLVYSRSAMPPEPSVESKRLANDIAYIRIASFRLDSSESKGTDPGPLDPSGHPLSAVEASKAKITEAFTQADKAKCLILDMRGNLGGTDLLGAHTALHLISGAFTYFKLQVRYSPQLQTVSGFEKSPAQGWGPVGDWSPPRPASIKPFSGPVLILQDPLCFSTTDNLLACLQDLMPGSQVRFIGRPSGGGTGAPRALAKLPWTGATLTLTVMKVFSPKGRLIEGRGTVPDRRIEWTWKDIVDGRDPDMELALDEAARLIPKEGSSP